jgi:hypothetical protein
MRQSSWRFRPNVLTWKLSPTGLPLRRTEGMTGGMWTAAHGLSPSVYNPAVLDYWSGMQVLRVKTVMLQLPRGPISALRVLLTRASNRLRLRSHRMLLQGPEATRLSASIGSGSEWLLLCIALGCMPVAAGPHAPICPWFPFRPRPRVSNCLPPRRGDRRCARQRICQGILLELAFALLFRPLSFSAPCSRASRSVAASREA